MNVQIFFLIELRTLAAVFLTILYVLTPTDVNADITFVGFLENVAQFEK